LKMITLCFSEPPSERKRLKGWWICVGGSEGFKPYPTKRLAAIALADIARSLTDNVRKLNAINGVSCATINAWIVQCHPYHLVRYIEARAAFDSQLLHISIRRKAKVPAEALPRVLGLLASARRTAETGLEIVPLAETFNLRLVLGQLDAIEAEIRAWQEGAAHGGDAHRGAAHSAESQEKRQPRLSRSA
jgi:hypothetical protein